MGLLLIVGAGFVLAATMLVVAKWRRITCFSGHHREVVEREFESVRGPTIYGVVCLECNMARCHINMQRPPDLPNDSYDRAVGQAQKWLRKTGGNIHGTFIGMG